MQRKIWFDVAAEADLVELYEYIAGQSGGPRALAYIERLTAYCEAFAEFPERGALRDDLRPGLRLIGFERRVLIAFQGRPDSVIFLRLLCGGRDADDLLSGS